MREEPSDAARQRLPNAEELPLTMGGYLLLRELGRGGMGVVYEAEEPGSKRRVALKLLPVDPDLPQEVRARFEMEGRLAAAVSHPNCVFVYGALDVDGVPAISMELQPGGTLEDRMRAGDRIDVETAVRWTMQLLDGLEAAHRAGVLHRDVKPSNAFLTAGDTVRIGDFGLSRTLHRDVRLTQSGAFLGSPLYASPEQVKAGDVDARSDVYSAGATLYALLAGRPPFGGQSFGEVLSKILTEEPPPLAARRTEIPKALEAVVRRSMAKDPAKRFASAAAFRDALAPFVSGKLAVPTLSKRAAAYAVDYAMHAFVGGMIVLALRASGAPGAETNPNFEGLFASIPLQLALYAAVAVAYFGLAEGAFGCTPGKWVLGLRVVDVKSGKRNFPRALGRAAVFAVPVAVAPTLALRFLYPIGREYVWLAALSPAPVMMLMFSTARRRNGHRGVHEFVSGTRTAELPVPLSRLLSRSAPLQPRFPRGADQPESIAHYSIEGTTARTPRGSLLLAKDTKLGRQVWIHAEHADAAPREIGVEDGGEARLRRIDSGSENGLRYEVIEACPGSPLREKLQSLTEAQSEEIGPLFAALRDACKSAAGAVSLDRLWADDMLHIRVSPAAFRPDPAPPAALEGLAVECARVLAHSSRGAAALRHAPAHVASLVRSLSTARDGAALSPETLDALDHLESGRRGVSRRVRSLQILIGSAPAVFLSASLLLVVPLVVPLIEAGELAKSIQTRDEARADDPPLRDAQLILISAGLQSKLWRGMIITLSDGAERIRKEARERFPAPSADQVESARAKVHAALPDAAAAPGVLGTLEFASAALWTALMSTLLFCEGFACAAAFVLRGGISLRLFGLELRTASGTRASRFRCLARGVVAAMLPLGGVAVASWLARHQMPFVAWAAGIASLAGAVACVLFAFRDLERGVPDRICRTRIAPR